MELATIELYKKQLEQRLCKLEEEQRSTAEDHKPVVLDQTTQGRLSRMDAMQVQAMALETKRRREVGINRIKATLSRIKEGKFGFCINCGDEIGVKRLDIDPSTPTCISCARLIFRTGKNLREQIFKLL